MSKEKKTNKNLDSYREQTYGHQKGGGWGKIIHLKNIHQ